MTLNKFVFRGDYYSMGLQHGEELRRLIHELANERISIICDCYSELSLPFISEIGIEIAQETEQQVPEVYEEIKGISHSSNIEIWKLIIAGGYSDVEHRVNTKLLNSQMRGISECTIIPVRNESGHVLLAGTWDSHATAEPALVVIERHPINGPSTLAMSTAGWPMQQGITSKKLGFAIANLIPATSRQGITYISALPRIISKSGFSSVVKSAISLRLCSGRFYAICDEKGNYAGIETDGYQYWVDSELVVHTNHYIYEGAKSVEGRIEYSRKSEKRRLSAEKKLSQLEHINTSTLFDIISYNDGTTASIAQLGVEREDRSCAGFVIDPTNLSITVTKGPPNLSRPKKYYFSV